jgi:hypothetical protein
MKEVIEFSSGEVREVIKEFYNNECRIDWCRTCDREKLSRKERKLLKQDTLEHIIPKKIGEKKGGTDHLRNLTFTVAFCNSKKGHDISNKKLLQTLSHEAETNWLTILKILLAKKIPLTGSSKGCYVVRILTIIYEVRITRNGNIAVLSDRNLTQEERTIIRIRDIQKYTSP